MCHSIFAVRAIDFWEAGPYTRVMMRLIVAVAVVFLAVGVAIVGYNVFILGMGLADALAFLYRYWQETTSDSGTTQNIQWMAIIATGLVLAWGAGSMRESGKY